MTKNNLALICTYGITNQKIRTAAEWQGLVNYYSNINKFLDINLRTIVFCGGYTNAKSPKISEAQSAKKYFNQNFQMRYKTEYGTKLNILTENTSSSSLENLVFGILTLKPFIKNSTKEILIFCDTVRETKIRFILEEIIKPNFTHAPQITFKIAAIQRDDDHPQSTLEKQNLEIINLKNNKLVQIYKKLLKEIFYAL